MSKEPRCWCTVSTARRTSFSMSSMYCAITLDSRNWLAPLALCCRLKSSALSLALSTARSLQDCCQSTSASRAHTVRLCHECCLPCFWWSALRGHLEARQCCPVNHPGLQEYRPYSLELAEVAALFRSKVYAEAPMHTWHGCNQRFRQGWAVSIMLAARGHYAMLLPGPCLQAEQATGVSTQPQDNFCRSTLHSPSATQCCLHCRAGRHWVLTRRRHHVRPARW